MKTFVHLAIPVCVCVLFPVISQAQDEISSIPFDIVPGNTAVTGGGTPISLQADTQVAGSLDATGEVATGSGFRFPDATVQTTAAAGASTTANVGLYANTIVDFAPPNAYTEICIKGGAIAFDIHDASEPTSGGNCLPGDVGWIIERFERSAGAAVKWYVARLECLKSGMRLPEAFERTVACADAVLFAISDMEDDWEWSTNTVVPEPAVAGALLAGNGGCDLGGLGSALSSAGPVDSFQYRCAR